MPDSIQEQIVKKVALALAEITNANGYDNTIASVQREHQNGMLLGPDYVPAILVREGTCTPDLNKSTHQRIRRRMELFAVIVTRVDEEVDARSGGEVLNSLVADVEKRLGASQTWDGLAMMTDPPEYLEVNVEATVPHLSRGLRTEIVYEHLRANPYSQ